jgi:spermidine synthase
LVKSTMYRGASGWRVATILAGTITAGTQIVLLREVLSVFLGNELVVGVLFFDWLALTGIGVVYAARWTTHLRPSLIPSVVLGSLLVLPPLTLFGVRLLPLLVAPPGSMLEIWIFLAGSILILSPVCLVSGGAFSLLVRASAAGRGANPVGNVYAWEAIGSLVGGALFGVLLFDLMSSQDLLLLLCVVSGSVGAAIAFRAQERKAAALLLAGVLVLAVARSLFDVNAMTFGLRYPGHTILAHEETPYGVLTATRLGDQTTIFANNIPLQGDGDVRNSEEIVHFALSQRPRSPSVLVVGGNPSALVPEVLKYPGSRVDCVEENPWLREIQQNFLHPPLDDRVQYVVGDFRQRLARFTGRYDVIILVSPEPSTLQSNRMYTRESMQLAHQALKPAGVLCLLLPSSEEYSGDDAKIVRATLRNTMAETFGAVLILPAGHDIFLASDSTLRADVAAAIAEAGVATTYANANYIQDDLLGERARGLRTALQRATPVNTDDHPVLMLAHIRYWLRFFSSESWVPAVIFLAAILLLLRVDRISIGVAGAGCGGIILELMVLMIVQVGFGNVYKMSGALIGLYMAGMSLGAFAGGRLSPISRVYGAVQSGLALTLLVTAFLQTGTPIGPLTGVAVLVICLFLGSLAAGVVFALTSRMLARDPVIAGSRLYGADLLGSAIGALLVGPFLLPLFGTHVVANAAAAVVVVGAAISLTSPVWRTHEKA